MEGEKENEKKKNWSLKLYVSLVVTEKCRDNCQCERKIWIKLFEIANYLIKYS